MPGELDTEIDDLLHKCGLGDPSASDRLLAFLYSELHIIAKACMEKQPPGHTLQATALVNEAFLKLVSSKERRWQSQTHFLSVAARAMRCVLVDHARARNRSKRAAPANRLALDQIVVSYEERALDLLLLDSALERLAQFDAPMARAVELRFFAGLAPAEIARILGLPKRTFDRHWNATRIWLWRQVS